jgi:hypothetical protein
VNPALVVVLNPASVCPMKLRLDLWEKVPLTMVLQEVEANNHRYQPELRFSKTGTGSLSSASMSERAAEVARGTAR